MLIVFLLGAIAVAAVGGLCLLAARGYGWAGPPARLGLQLGLVAAAFAIVWSVLLLLVGCPEGCAPEDAGLWTDGKGQQFAAAVAGFAAVIIAFSSGSHRGYRRAAMALLVAAACFAVWGLLLYTASSNEGPLA